MARPGGSWTTCWPSSGPSGSGTSSYRPGPPSCSPIGTRGSCRDWLTGLPSSRRGAPTNPPVRSGIRVIANVHSGVLALRGEYVRRSLVTLAEVDPTRHETRRQGEQVMADLPATVWVAELYVSASTEQKLIHRHNITVDEVEQAVKCVKGLRGRWDVDSDRGVRALIWVTIRSRRVLVVLYPTTAPDVWNLGSAYFQP